MANSMTTSVALNLLFFFTLTSACGYCPGIEPKPKPKSTSKYCPVDTLKLGVCANVLNNLIPIEIGKPPKEPCCSLIEGLADDEAALCLCTSLKANVLGIKLNIPISLSLLLNYCGKKTPTGFQCP